MLLSEDQDQQRLVICSINVDSDNLTVGKVSEHCSDYNL
jgi:hypothetical protein